MCKKDFDISGDTLLKYRGNDYEVEIPYGIKKIGESAFIGNLCVM